ncbi:MAG: TolB family protein [Acidimicrobiales bacterium]
MNDGARRALLLVLLVAGSWLSSATSVGAARNRVELASSDRRGRAVGTDDFLPPSLDRSGRYLLFRSEADAIVPSDLDGQWDLFRKDVATGRVEQISVGVVGPAYHGDISANGRFVAFYADRTYVRDVRRGVTIVVDEGQPHTVDAPAVSDDGAVVAFRDGTSLYVADRTTGPTQRTSVGNGTFFDLTPEGRWIVFDERDGSGARIIRLDRRTGARTTVYDGPGGDGTGPVFPSSNADGSVISFTLLEALTKAHAFVWDRGVLETISDAPLSAAGQVSDDGRHVVLFEALDFDAEPGDLLVLDRRRRTILPIGRADNAWGISLSCDGSAVSWTTRAALAAGDGNEVSDVYVTRVGRP